MTKKEYTLKVFRLNYLLEALTNKGKLSKKRQAELDQLLNDIAQYEETKLPFEPNTLKEMIQLRMFQRKLKQKDLAIILGTTPSRVSEFLNGKRGLTMELAKRLYKKMNISAELILNDAHYKE